MTKKIMVHLAAFFAAVAVMWGLLVLTSLIPNEKIYEGLMESADHYGNTEAFPLKTAESYAMLPITTPMLSC